VPDFEFLDHRVLGLGALDRDRWIASLRAQVDMSSEVAAEALRVMAWNRHGLVIAVRVFGEVQDGGPFENFLVALCLNAGDHARRFEVFGIDDADRAISRFEELCASVVL